MCTSDTSDAGSYRMINSIELTNFRCFEHERLNDLKTINIVVGENASGKTAFLEALFLPLGNPSLSFKLRNWRGLGSMVAYSDDSESRSALWRDLFYKFDQKLTVKVDIIGTPNVARTVRITSKE